MRAFPPRGTMKLFHSFLQDDTGATALEYGLIAALIALALIGGATSLGKSLDGIFSGAGEDMTAANAPGVT